MKIKMPVFQSGQEVNNTSGIRKTGISKVKHFFYKILSIDDHAKSLTHGQVKIFIYNGCLAGTKAYMQYVERLVRHHESVDGDFLGRHYPFTEKELL